MKMKADIDQKMDIAKTVAIGLLFAMIIMFTSIAGISFAAVKSVINENIAHYLLVLTHAFSAFVGCTIAHGITKKKALTISISILGMYLTVLSIINAVVFSGDYQSITQSSFAVILGTTIAYILQYRKKGREKHRYRERKW